jgi:hypothetical protein
MFQKILLAVTGFSISALATAQDMRVLQTDVLVVGGGTGGVAAGIQSARQKVNTIVVEPTPWLGGMLTAAGVSATDGNHNLPSGLWEEFRQALYKHYGTKNLATGWVSNTLFEPRVGDSIFKVFCKQEPLLTVLHGYTIFSVVEKGNCVKGVNFINKDGAVLQVLAKMTIDATEQGDVMAMSGTAFDLGTEDAALTKETMAPGKSDVIQDLTYAAILKDYGRGTDRTIARPEGYDSTQFFKSCLSRFNTDTGVTKTTAEKMLQYGKIRNGKYMINWPPYGNDLYLNVINKTPAEREKNYELAKNMTLQFIYYIQKDLGFKHLGLADDEFDTPDQLPYIPYNRESRRLKGKVRLTLNEIQSPFSKNYYRTGISVGDYPIDHHHDKNKGFAKIKFPPVPSYNIPLGALIPTQMEGLIVADKNISVSNLANGTTRLQPVVLLTGQAAGALAAHCVKKKVSPAKANIREVQQQLLNAKCYLMPYVDVSITDTAWQAIQKAGALGIIKGVGKPEGWANKTFFHPDSVMSVAELTAAISALQKIKGKIIVTDNTVAAAWDALANWQHQYRILKKIPHKWPSIVPNEHRIVLRAYKIDVTNIDHQPITRRQFAILTDALYYPFNAAINFEGNYLK